MSQPSVQLLLEGRVLQTLPFAGDRLRIGRMTDNDLVVPDRAVSRAHAVIERGPDGQFAIEDLGSGNGCWVGDVRVEGRRRLAPGDAVRMGRHLVRLIAPGAEGADSSLFDFALESDLAAVGVEFDVGPEELEDAASVPDPSGAPAAGDEEEMRVSIVEEPLEHEPEMDAAPFADDEGSDLDALANQEGADLESFADQAACDLDSFYDAPEAFEAEPQESLSPQAAEPEGAGTDPGPDPLVEQDGPRSHAGLVVQVGGRLDRVMSLEGERICIGRGEDCEVVLDAPGVSRHHALIVREGNEFELRDLESINGTHLNGEPVRREPIGMGDVIGIDEFELTFLLDHSPITDEVCTTDAAQVLENGDREARHDLTSIQGLLGDAIDAEADALPLPEPGDFPTLRPVVTRRPEAPMPLDDDEATGDPASASDRGDAELVQQVARELAPPRLRLELLVDADALPEPLRKALAELGGEEATLPVELRIKTRP